MPVQVQHPVVSNDQPDALQLYVLTSVPQVDWPQPTVTGPLMPVPEHEQPPSPDTAVEVIPEVAGTEALSPQFTAIIAAPTNATGAASDRVSFMNVHSPPASKQPAMKGHPYAHAGLRVVTGSTGRTAIRGHGTLALCITRLGRGAMSAFGVLG